MKVLIPILFLIFIGLFCLGMSDIIWRFDRLERRMDELILNQERILANGGFPFDKKQ